MSDATIIRLKHRRTEQIHEVTAAAWKALQEAGKGDAYEELTAPPMPKEVAKLANDKMAG